MNVSKCKALLLAAALLTLLTSLACDLKTKTKSGSFEVHFNVVVDSCGVWREDSVLLSMPGRKQVPHLVMTGAYRGFLELRCLNGVSEKVRRGAQGDSLQESGKSGLHAHGDGEQVFALESW